MSLKGKNLMEKGRTLPSAFFHLILISGIVLIFYILKKKVKLTQQRLENF